MSTVAPSRPRTDPVRVGTWEPTQLSPRLLVVLLLPLAAALGALLSYDPKLGIAACAALVFATVVFLAMPVAIGALVVLMFASGLPGMAGVPAASTAVVGLAWFATLPARRQQVSAVRGGASLVLVAPWLLFGWMIATTIWAPDTALATSRLWQVFTAIVTVPIIALGVDRARTMHLVVGAYVTGAAMIVALAIVLGPSSFALADEADGRLAVANFSANLLGAMVVTALVLVPSVHRNAGTPLRRLVVLLLGALLMYGIVATQSRSSFIALGVAAVAALVICRGRRRAIAGGIGAATVVFALFIALHPGILDRTENGDSTGRDGIWKAAVAVWKDHPVGGVGVGNFVAVSPGYALRIGTLDSPAYVTDEPVPPHNVVLEALSETGVPGLALLALAIGAGMVATGRAARSFARRGDDDLDLLSRLVLVAQIAMVTGGLFLPITTNRQLWALLGIGAALYGIAARAERRAADGDEPGEPLPSRERSR